jgi:GNAT superfamily N-acetyltransferase
MNIVLKQGGPDDDPFLKELFHEVHAPEFSSLDLAPAMLAQLLDLQYRAQKHGYTSQFPAAEDSIILVEGEYAGRLLVSRGSVIHLVDIALVERHRGKGIGGTLIRSLCGEAREMNKPLSLSVRSGNPAEDLYRRLGFVRTGGDGLNFMMELQVK